MEHRNRASLACFYADAPIHAGATIVLPESASHHAIVRRVKPGDAVAITNGAGAIGRGQVARLTKRAMEVEVAHVESVDAPPAVHLRAPVADRDRMLWAAEKATELGVTSWQSIHFRRSASVSPRGEGPAFAERLRSRMISALEQSSGAWLPRILEESPLSSIDTLGGQKIVLHGEGESVLDVLTQRDVPVAILVGPEGGIEEDEMRALAAEGWRPASLGPTTLRFETAAVAALSIVRAVQLSHPSFGVASRAQ